MGKVVFTTKGYIEAWWLPSSGPQFLSRHRSETEAIESVTAHAAQFGDDQQYELRFPSKLVKAYGILAPSVVNTPPTQPQNLTVNALGATSVGLRWDPSTDDVGVTGYQVWRDGTAIQNVGGTSTTDNGLSPATTYAYKVAAYDAAGNVSEFSTTIQVTTESNAAPVWSNPGTQVLTVNSAYSLNLADLVSDSDDDPITIALASGTLPSGITFNSVAKTVSGTPSVAATTQATFSASDGIAPPVNLSITFQSLNADSTAPSVPTGLAGVGIGGERIELVWNASTDPIVSDARTSGVVGYRVYRDGALRVTLGNVLSYSDTQVAADTQYSYAVSAVDAAGNASAQSAAVVVATVAFGWTIPDVVYNVSTPDSGTLVPDGTWTYDVSRHVTLAGKTPVYSLLSVTPPAAGISIDSASGVITGTVSAAGSYDVTVDLAPAAQSTEQDWLARSTGEGVIFAHDFRSDAEVLAFVDSSTNTRVLARAPKRIANALGESGALRTVAWASTLAVALPNAANGGIKGDVGTTDLFVADATTFADIWPTPDGSTLWLLVGPGSTAEKFRVESIDFGTNKLVIRRGYDNVAGDYRGSIYAHVVGERVGFVSSAWNRPLCAFNAGINGKAEADRGITTGVATPHRFKLDRADTSYVEFSPTRTRAFSRFVGGMWGHPQHQAEYPVFGDTSSGAGSDTPHYTDSPWMGDEFYLQFRVRFPKSRFEVNTPSKVFYLDNVSETGCNQIYCNFEGEDGGASASNVPAPPPGAVQPYFAMGDWQTNGMAGVSNWGEYLSQTQLQSGLVFYDRKTGSSAYPDAIWGQLNRSKQAWCWVPDKWITLLVYNKPGRQNWYRQAYGFLTNGLAAVSSLTDQSVQQIVVTNSATDGGGRTMLNATFPKPSDIKPSGPGAGSAWGNYGIQVTSGGQQGSGSWTEILQVQDAVDNGDGTQTLTVMRNWFRDGGLNVALPANHPVWFGPQTTRVPSTHPASARASVHLVPYKEWHFRVWAHIEGQSGYTELIDKDDYVSLFGDNGSPNWFGRNPPGYNAFRCYYYPNPYNGGNGAPSPTFQDFTQIILSRSFIPCPADL